MAALTVEQLALRRAQKAARAEQARRIDEAHREAQRAVLNGCPKCGRPIRHNLAILGWVQCEQYGSPQFRKDREAAGCTWQGFTR